MSKNSVLKFSNDVYTTIQALKCYNLIKNDVSPANLTKVVETMKSDVTLKKLGFKFTANGDHFKLNELLKSADIEIIMEKGERVTVNGKKVRLNTYSIAYISAADILVDLKDPKYAEM